MSRLVALFGADPAKWNDLELITRAPWGRFGLWLGLAVAFAIVALSAYGYRREPLVRRLGLIGLRLLVVLGALTLYLQPGIELRAVDRLPSHVAILVDESRSMSIADRPGESSRADRARAWLQAQAPALAELRKRHPVELYGFAEALVPRTEEDLKRVQASGGSTRIREAVAALRQRYGGAELGGVVVVSDGIDNGGLREAFRGADEKLDLEAKRFLESLAIPVHAIWVGRPGLRDVSIRSLATDDFAFVRTPVKVEVAIEAHGYEGQVLALSLRREGQVVETQPLRLDKGDGIWRVSFTIAPEHVGTYVYEVVTPVLQGEALTTNNGRAFVLKVIRDKVRVLQVCGRPSWDERFLRALLKRDPGVDLISFFILRTPTDLQLAAQSELSLIQFPTRELFDEELKSFDVVILQNFNYEPYAVGQYLPRIREYVLAGGGLAMVGGDLSFASGGYGGSPLADLLPVELPGGRPLPGLNGSSEDRLLATESFRPRLTTAGRVHPITALTLDPRDSGKQWTELPPLEGINRVLGLRQGAYALLEHPTLKGEGSTPLPVVAVAEAGQGRTLALTTDTAWRWDFWASRGNTPQAGHHTFQKFWENAIRWLIRDPSQRLLQLQADTSELERTGTARIRVRLLGSDYQPRADSPVSVEVSLEGRPLGKTALRTGDEGEAHWELEAKRPGIYRVTARGEVSGRPLEEKEVFLVRADGRELEEIAARSDLLGAMAEATGGELRGVDSSLAQLRFLDEGPVRIGKREQVELWSGTGVFLVTAGLLAFEWIVRRKRGYA